MSSKLLEKWWVDNFYWGSLFIHVWAVLHKKENAWKGAKETEPERQKETWMPVVRFRECGWGGDEILSYLSRQLHIADFYLSWQKGMWGSLQLALNDYLFVNISHHFPFSKPEGGMGILTPTTAKDEDGSEIECGVSLPPKCDTVLSGTIGWPGPLTNDGKLHDRICRTCREPVIEDKNEYQLPEGSS